MHMLSRSETVEIQPTGEPEPGRGLDTSGLVSSASKSGGERIKVVVRIRPLLTHETGPEVVVVGPTNTICVNGATAHRQLQCRYDAVVGSDTSQEGMFSHVCECTSAVLEGENSTIFAYGQTGSGKTYTMFGPDLDNNGCVTPGYGKGVIPLAVTDLFKGLTKATRKGKNGDEYSVWVSLVQLYNEQLYDMLRDPQRVYPLAIHEQVDAGIYVQGLSEYAVHSAGECLQLLRVGREHRAIRETHMNQASSRSHSIFQIVVEQKRKSEQDGERVLRSKFNLVDLAGSEKWDVKQDMEEVRVNEMTNINVSLYTLGRVIAALGTPNGRGDRGTRKGHIPYRDSKLTRLLQDSLGGNTRTRIIATLSPATQCLDETISTLRFADRAKQVMAYVRVNEHRPVDHALVNRLQAEVKHLRGLLQSNTADPELENETCDRPTRPAALTALAEADILGYQETIEQLRRENAALRDNRRSIAAVEGGNQDSQQESGMDLETLKATNRALQNAIEHIVRNLRRFFRFDIEEDDLREDLTNLLSHLSGSVAGAKWCFSPNAPTSNPSFASVAMQADGPTLNEDGKDGNEGGVQNRDHSFPPASPKSKGGATARGHSHHQDFFQGECVRLPTVPGVTVEGEPRSEKLAYRLRGKHADDVVVVMKKEMTDQDEERQLRKQLKLAKERMKKNIQLQEWLLQKEQREIEVLASESEKREQMERDRRRKDEEFRRRAAKQKAKLKRFYENAQVEARRDAEKKDQELLYGQHQAVAQSSDDASSTTSR